jgi:hypothetical protein
VCAARRSGQGTVEWIALIALISLALGAIAWQAGVRLPGAALARAIGERIVCAVRLAHGCRSDPALLGGYGPELAETVRAQAPRIAYENGMHALPVDFRRCREPACADGPDDGRTSRSLAGTPAAAFTHVIDCRDQQAAAEKGYDCSGGRAGNVYVQYWLYYANSATLKGVPVAGPRGFHLDDWESYQVRIAPDGAVSARASSHHGYNARGGIGNWASDAGWGAGTRVSDELGLHDRNGWAPSRGTLWVSGGSHAGHTTEASLRRELARLLAEGEMAAGGEAGRGTPAALDRRYELARRARNWERALFGPGARFTPRGSLRLVPIETLEGRDSSSFAVSPPWRKRVYYDPEYGGTD